VAACVHQHLTTLDTSAEQPPVLPLPEDLALAYTQSLCAAGSLARDKFAGLQAACSPVSAADSAASTFSSSHSVLSCQLLISRHSHLQLRRVTATQEKTFRNGHRLFIRLHGNCNILLSTALRAQPKMSNVQVSLSCSCCCCSCMLRMLQRAQPSLSVLYQTLHTYMEGLEQNSCKASLLKAPETRHTYHGSDTTTQPRAASALLRKRVVPVRA
jgi:hypothetical protein